MNKIEKFLKSVCPGRSISVKLMNGQVIRCAKNGKTSCPAKSEPLPFNPQQPTLTQRQLQEQLHAEQCRRAYYRQLFAENAWFLLENADHILNDGMMFMASANVRNSVSFIGNRGMEDPTIGSYIEWWLNYPEASRDANGNLVFCISGLMGGSNYSKVVTPVGEIVDIAARTAFADIWKSFMIVNSRYARAKQCAKAYTLEEVLLKLHGQSYQHRLTELHQQCFSA